MYLLITVVLLLIFLVCLSILPQFPKNPEITEIPGDIFPLIQKIPKDYFFSNSSQHFFNISAIKNNDIFEGVGRIKEYDSKEFSYLYYSVFDITGKQLSSVTLNFDYTLHPKARKNYYYGLEDPRIFHYQNQKWIISNSIGLSKQRNPNLCTMMICPLNDTSNPLYLDYSNNHEKNWAPFEQNGTLYMEYSVDPHIILELQGNKVVEHSRTNYYLKNLKPGSIGSLRCSTPAVKLNEHFISLGHMIDNNGSYLHYWYIFSLQSPFQVLKVSPFFKFPETTDKLQFACSLSQDEGSFYVSYSRNDKENRIIRYPKEKILEMFL